MIVSILCMCDLPLFRMHIKKILSNNQTHAKPLRYKAIKKDCNDPSYLAVKKSSGIRLPLHKFLYIYLQLLIWNYR